MAQLSKPSAAAVDVPVILYKDNEWSNHTQYLMPTSELILSLRPKLIRCVHGHPDSNVRVTLTSNVHHKAYNAYYVVNQLSKPLAYGTPESHNMFIGHTIIVTEPLAQSKDSETSPVPSETKIPTERTLTQAQVRDAPSEQVSVPRGADFDGDVPMLPAHITVFYTCRTVIGPSDEEKHTFWFDCPPHTTIEELRKKVWKKLSKFESRKYLLAEDAYEMIIRDPELAVDKRMIVSNGILQVNLKHIRPDRTVASLFVTGLPTSAPIKLLLVLNPATPVNFHVRLDYTPNVTQQIVTLTVADTVMALYERVRGVIGYDTSTNFTLAAIPVRQVPTKGVDGDVEFKSTVIPKCGKTLSQMGLIKEHHIEVVFRRDVSNINALSQVTVDFVCQNLGTNKRASFDRERTTSKDIYDYVSKETLFSIDNFYLEWSYPRPAKHICPTFPLSNRKAFTHLTQDECTLAVRMAEDGARVAHSERDCSDETDAQIFEELAKYIGGAKDTEPNERKPIEDLGATIGMLTDKVKLLNDIQVLLEHKKKYIEAAKELGDSFDNGVSPALIEQVSSFIPEVVNRTLPVVLAPSSWKKTGEAEKEMQHTSSIVDDSTRGACGEGLFELVTLGSYLSEDGCAADMKRIDKELKEAKDKIALLIDIKHYKEAVALKNELAARMQERAKQIGFNLDECSYLRDDPF